MKSTGIIRNIDELGRIVIPKEIRKKFGLSSTDPVEIFIEGDKIVLTRYQASCSFCDSCENIVEFKGKKICKACLYELKKDY
jgi:transcriptional pleiotropic regulator of transition state genes